MQALYLDAFSGISGNMCLGGLLDLGVPESYLRCELDKLALPGYKLTISKLTKCGIAATYVDVEPTDDHGHGHGQRRLADITKLVEGSALESEIKQKTVKVFNVLAQAEAKVHNIAVDEVHFHEVGAVDTIVDVVGVAVCLQWLRTKTIFVGKVRTGSGFVQCAHGLLPVPAPATAELLAGIPFYQGDIEKELATPTGAAILAALAQASPGVPDGFITTKIGYGAGKHDLPLPNTLRIMQGEIAAKQEHDRMLVAETNIDDMNPQFYSHIMKKLFGVGASDVWITPIIMKKGRPACLLSVLLRDSLLGEISQAIFAETSTLGVRYYAVERNTLERHTEKMKLPYGEVHIKYGKFDGKIVNLAPEFEDCSNLSALTGRPLKEIWQEAIMIAGKNNP